MAFNIYTTASMLEALRSLRVVPQFLLTMFFPGFALSDDEEIKFDVEIDNVQVAPFVAPTSAGRIMRDKGLRTDTFKPAYVKPLHDIKPNEPLVRTMGEPIGGSLSAGERELVILTNKLDLQSKMIRRRSEVMAAEALVNGTVTVAGEDYPTTVVDFGRSADLTVTLTGAARWGESGVSAWDSLEDFIDEVSTACGAAVNIVVMTTDAWRLLKADEKFDKALDRTLGQSSIVDLGFKPGTPGSPSYRGKVGDVEFYTYNDTYEDSDGSTKSLLPNYTVLVGATAAVAGVRHYGAILDPKAGYQALEIYPKSWIEENPPRRMLMSQSAPMVVPRRPNATGRMTVR